MRCCGSWREASSAAQPASPSETQEFASAAELSEKLAHPLWLVERWVRRFGLDRARQICRYDQHPPVAAVRLTGGGTEAELTEDGIELAPGRCWRPRAGFGREMFPARAPLLKVE